MATPEDFKGFGHVKGDIWNVNTHSRVYFAIWNMYQRGLLTVTGLQSPSEPAAGYLCGQEVIEDALRLLRGDQWMTMNGRIFFLGATEPIRLKRPDD